MQDEWDLLGFALIEGRHADYGPGSPDLATVTTTMTKLGDIPCPDEPVKHAPHRWRGYVAPKPGASSLRPRERAGMARDRRRQPVAWTQGMAQGAREWREHRAG